jgi:hypothetical protein
VEDVRPHWDELTLNSWVDADMLYQEGGLERILPLSEFAIDRLRPKGRDLIMFLGTVPLLGGTFVMSKQFRGELSDPVLRRTIGFSYTIQQLPG